MPCQCFSARSDLNFLAQANAVLQEVQSSTEGNTIQIVFERQAQISPEALAGLIQQACYSHLPIISDFLQVCALMQHTGA